MVCRKPTRKAKACTKGTKIFNLPGRLSPAVYRLCSVKPFAAAFPAELYISVNLHTFKVRIRCHATAKHTIRPDDAGIFMHESLNLIRVMLPKSAGTIFRLRNAGKDGGNYRQRLNKYLSETYTSSTRFNYLSKN